MVAAPARLASLLCVTVLGVSATSAWARAELASSPAPSASQDSQSLRFSPEVELRVGWAPFRMAAADVDGDGHQDLVTVSIDESTAVLHFGRGDGTFTARTVYRARQVPWAPAIADLDGDGDRDLIVAGGGRRGWVAMWENRGSRRLVRTAVYSTAPRAFAVVAHDVDRDGDVDLTTAHDNRTHLGVLLADGRGGFRRGSPYTGRAATDVAVGDLNADGIADVALATRRRVAVVRLGRGDGTFGHARLYQSGRDPFGVTLADVNHDTRLDLLVADYLGRAIRVRLGAGDGAFGPETRYAMGEGYVETALVADFDRDGNLDIAAPEDGGELSPPYSGAIIRPGLGDGTFGPRLDVARRFRRPTVGGAVADFDADGWPDLAVSVGEDWECDYGPCGDSAFVFLNWTAQTAPRCVVPSLRFLFRRQARRALEAAGCRLGAVSRRASRYTPSGRVVAQRPRMGVIIPAASRVDVVLSSGRPRSPQGASGQPRHSRSQTFGRLAAHRLAGWLR